LVSRDGISEDDARDFATAERTKMVEFIQGCDLAILDTQYTDEEYTKHVGWGHSSISSVVSLALDADVRQLLLFHHDPNHDDEMIDQMVEHARALVKKSGKTLEDLKEILEAVHLAYLPAREGGWDTRKEWKDVLSGGEKQRMGMARLFYHRPKFGVLDECTSAVSTDVEGIMYQHAKDLGITLITISHRPTLTKYHNRLLTLTGDAAGSWALTTVGTAEERMGIDREILLLESKLAEVETWQKRVKELEVLLGTGNAQRTRT